MTNSSLSGFFGSHCYILNRFWFVTSQWLPTKKPQKWKNKQTNRSRKISQTSPPTFGDKLTAEMTRTILFFISDFTEQLFRLFFFHSVAFLFPCSTLSIICLLKYYEKNKAMQNKATTGFKTFNAWSFFLKTAWLTKDKFLYTEEYRLYIPFSADCICHVHVTYS